MAVGSSADLTIRDKTSELGTFSVPSYQIDAANLATWLTGWATFKTATQAIIEGVQAKETIKLYETVLSNAVPASNSAQRERKFLVRFTADTTGDKFRRSLPTANLNAVELASGVGGFSDYVVLDDGGVMAAWVAAFEAIARNPEDDTENVTVTSVQHIGVNS